MNVSYGMTCGHCGGAVTVVAMTSDGSRATCSCGRTTLTTHLGKPVVPRPIVDRDPGDEQP